MLKRTSWMAAVIAGWLIAAGAAFALDQPQLKDEAGFFKPATVEKADKILQAIKKNHGVDVTIETFKTVPPDMVKEVKSMSRKRLARFFSDWARDRAQMLDVQGIYVLICKTPPYDVVHVSADLEEHGFTEENRKVLLKKLPHYQIFSSSYDGKLLEGLDYVDQALSHNLSAQPQTTSPAWMTWVWVILGVVGAWVVLGALRALLSIGAQPPPPSVAGNVAQSNSGMFGGLLGGMFGATLGGWIYEVFFRSQPPASPPRPAAPASERLDEELDRRGQRLTGVDDVAHRETM